MQLTFREIEKAFEVGEKTLYQCSMNGTCLRARAMDRIILILSEAWSGALNKRSL